MTEGPALDEANDELDGHEKMLEREEPELAFDATDDEVVIRELGPLEDDRGDVEVGTIVFVETSVIAVVSPDEVLVAVLVTIKRTVVAVELPELEVGLGNETVNAPLEVELEIPVGVTGLLKDVEGEGFAVFDVATITVVDTMITVVVPPPESVLVSVVKMLDVTGSTGLEGTIVGEGLVPPTGALVDVGIELPELMFEVTKESEISVDTVDIGVMMLITVLVLVMSNPLETVLVNVVRRLDVVGTMGGGAPIIVVEVLVNVVVCPPDIVLVIVNKAVEVANGSTLFPSDVAVTVDAVIMVKVIVWPPGIMLVNVVVTLETTGGGVLGETPGGSVREGAGAGTDGNVPLLDGPGLGFEGADGTGGGVAMTELTEADGDGTTT
jgi:hypothetical protein